MDLALVVAVMRSGEQGGAEALYDGLHEALIRAGHRVDRIEVPLDESSFDRILEAYVRCRDLDLRAYDAVISTKAPTFMVRHPRHISYLLHTIRVFYDMFAREYGDGTPEQHHQRRVIHACDRYGLHPDRVLGHFANGRTPYRRLQESHPFWNRVPFEALHHPPRLEGFRPPRPGRHIFMPGRLHRWKRFDLLIEAFRRVRADIPLKLAGTGEDEEALRRAAAGDPRIEFLGRVDDATLLELYADAVAVPFVPFNEDYGLVTVEAFLSRKPVITCVDSGEPAELVADGVSGFVIEPTPAAIAARLEFLIERPEAAAAMGERGHQAVSHITWSRVVARLLAPLPSAGRARSACSPAAPVAGRRAVKVLVTDNQCIEPAIGGGRLRLLGLYATLTEGVEATYVGTYDWPGPTHRELVLSPRLREIDVPLSDEHFALNAYLNGVAPGQVIVDVTVPWLVAISPDFVATVRRHAAESDVVVFSHPWVYACLRDELAGKRVIYDSHNCEARLRRDLLGSTALGRCLAEHVRWVEGELCRRSDAILACSEGDKAAFEDLYDVAPDKIVIVPNGIDVEALQLPTGPGRGQARARLGLTAPTALFVGSGYPPNAEALAFIVGELAPSTPELTFLVVGGVAEYGAGVSLAQQAGPNVRILGTVTDSQRNEAYAAADFAINPMFTGSGVNIKMLDFLASGLPTVTTAVGARGLLNPEGACFIVDRAEQFGPWLRRLAGDPDLCTRLAANGRALVERHYDSRRLSRELGELIARLAGSPVRSAGGGDAPYFSVVIPTYRRPERLRELLELLETQTFRGFDVVIVDQSEQPFDLATVAVSIHLEYVHTDVPGATRARNLGVARARGRVVAFTDDDCRPDPAWLDNARRYFDDPNVIGVEGLVESDVERSEGVRVVTNVGFEGFGFMTANLFVRKTVLERIHGFDERFDRPHFREDTDLAWRALDYGRIPFGHDVRVLHPAHPVGISRESKEERVRFFVHDPLLFAKHPDRYVELLRREGHYATEPAFWPYFLKGMLRHRVRIPFERLAQFMPDEVFLAARELDRLVAAGEAAYAGTESPEILRPITV